MNAQFFYEMGRLRIKPFAYYAFENNLIAKYAGTSANFIGLSPSYSTGKVGFASSFNGTNTPTIYLPNLSIFSFTDGVSDKPFSIGFYLQLNSTADQMILNKVGSPTNTKAEYWLRFNANKLSFILFSNGDIANYIMREANFTPTLNTWYYISISYDGSGTAAGMSLMIDLVDSSVKSMGGTYVKMIHTDSTVQFGKSGWAATRFFNGKIDCLSFFNQKLTIEKWTKIKALHDAGLDL